MGIDFDYLKSRIVELRGILQELARLILRLYPDLSLDERYSLRYIRVAQSDGRLGNRYFED